MSIAWLRPLQFGITVYLFKAHNFFFYSKMCAYEKKAINLASVIRKDNFSVAFLCLSLTSFTLSRFSWWVCCYIFIYLAESYSVLYTEWEKKKNFGSHFVENIYLIIVCIKFCFWCVYLFKRCAIIRTAPPNTNNEQSTISLKIRPKQNNLFANQVVVLLHSRISSNKKTQEKKTKKN